VRERGGFAQVALLNRFNAGCIIIQWKSNNWWGENESCTTRSLLVATCSAMPVNMEKSMCMTVSNLSRFVLVSAFPSKTVP